MAVRTACSVLVLVLISACLTPAVGQDGSRPTHSIQERWSAACASKIGHPVYPAVALQSGLIGSVSAEFSVDQSGNATSIVVNGSVPFQETVRAAIGGTNFPAACAGRKVEITFAFQSKANLPAHHHVSACFSPLPNLLSVSVGESKAMCVHYTLVALVASEGITPITVCELLADPLAYNGKAVALLGRDDGAYDSSWLGADECGSKLISEGHVWPNLVARSATSSGPSPPMGLLVLDRDGLARKLALAKRTTSLGMTDGFVHDKDGWKLRQVRQSWNVVFGRIEAREQLRPPQVFPTRDWGNGFGNNNAAPVEITYSKENEFILWDTPPDN